MAELLRKNGNHLESIINRFQKTVPFEHLRELLEQDQSTELPICGMAGSSPAILLSCLKKQKDRPIIAILADPDEAANLYDDLVFLLGENEVSHYPSRMVSPFEFRSPSAEISGLRLATLSRLSNGTAGIIVTPISALIEPTISRADFNDSRLYLKTGQEMEIDALAERLVRLGFQRVPMVEEVGDFALRGGLIDFFSPGFDSPVRVEFFGDTIETIRNFEVPTQRTLEKLNEIILLPKREIPITPNTIEQYIERLPEKDSGLIRARYINDPELPGLEWSGLLVRDCNRITFRLSDRPTDFCDIWKGFASGRNRR